MFNVGGGELLVILLIALVVLGPQKLPDAARQIGGFARELRKMSNSFQAELKSAMDEPSDTQAAENEPKITSSDEPASPADDASAKADEATTDGEADPSGEDPAISTAEAAGMYDVAPKPDPADDEPDAPVSTAEAAGMYDVAPKPDSAEAQAETNTAEPES